MVWGGEAVVVVVTRVDVTLVAGAMVAAVLVAAVLVAEAVVVPTEAAVRSTETETEPPHPAANTLRRTQRGIGRGIRLSASLWVFTHGTLQPVCP